MPVPDSREVRERLLDLFPKDAIHESPYVDEPMRKAEAIETVVDNAADEELTGFVAANFNRLHQHVYIFEWNPPEENPDPDQLFDEEPIQRSDQEDEIHHYYLLDHIYSLVLEPPLTREELSFSRPVKIAIGEDHLRVHMTTMKKSPSSYIDEDRSIVRSSPRPKEQTLLENFRSTRGITGYTRRMDLNRGIKALWQADVIDSDSITYKRPKATSSDEMDEDFTVKEDDPDLYQDVQDKPLFGTTFLLTVEDPCTKYFVTDPTDGRVIFRRHSSTNDCVDRVVRRIVEAN